LKNPAEIVSPDFKEETRLACPALHETASSGELIYFAREHPADKDLGLGFAAGSSHDLDAALQYDEDAMDRVSLIEEDGACFRLTSLPECRKARDLRIIQLREHRIGLRGSFRHMASGYSRTVRLFKDNFIDVTPHPILARLERSN